MDAKNIVIYVLVGALIGVLLWAPVLFLEQIFSGIIVGGSVAATVGIFIEQWRSSRRKEF